ncbi:hypothetical protein [Candidatus Ichthyocystis hellenicum]|uniref:hypothetical protein n=1 Tax=Candidatus Ichthyocystis hellenicum TaxID=1561003 RepID=UPI000B88994E|nr:hypothetical protein [Candidatus Ichthyocystis hellenicum]
MSSSRVTIGWALFEESSAVLFYPPEPLSSLYSHKPSGVSACPAVQHYERRVFHIRSPYTFRIRANFDNKKWYFYPIYPFTEMPESSLFERIQFQPRSSWRDPFIPVLQMLLPYVFVSDEDVFLNQIEAPCFKNRSWSLISGRFNIYDWQRPINWAISWVDTSMDIIVRRGDVLFSLMFESNHPDRSISLQRVPYEGALKSLVDETRGVSTQIRGTFGLFSIQRHKRTPILNLEFGHDQ